MTKVETSITYEKGRPKLGGLSDLRMGTTERGIRCETDGELEQTSPGYFGHIELARPMYHVGFIRQVCTVLRCISYQSSKLLLNKVSFLQSAFFVHCTLLCFSIHSGSQLL